eukprot:Seg9461.1 transcript_id=Seg9461.1/GoldUCD/mRNA.D3Y31 product="hypothetical protein" protein_id=Seg9461.1/GoldUCD/D3Y31
MRKELQKALDGYTAKTSSTRKASQEPIKASQEPIKANQEPIKANQEPIKANQEPIKAKDDNSMSDQSREGIEPNSACQHLEEPVIDAPSETPQTPVTPQATASCLKCPIIAKKLVSYQKENSRMKKAVVELKERLEEMQRKVEDMSSSGDEAQYEFNSADESDESDTWRTMKI